MTLFPANSLIVFFILIILCIFLAFSTYTIISLISSGDYIYSLQIIITFILFCFFFNLLGTPGLSWIELLDRIFVSFPNSRKSLQNFTTNHVCSSFFNIVYFNVLRKVFSNPSLLIFFKFRMCVKFYQMIFLNLSRGPNLSLFPMNVLT